MNILQLIKYSQILLQQFLCTEPERILNAQI